MSKAKKKEKPLDDYVLPLDLTFAATSITEARKKGALIRKLIAENIEAVSNVEEGEEGIMSLSRYRLYYGY